MPYLQCAQNYRVFQVIFESAHHYLLSIQDVFQQLSAVCFKMKFHFLHMILDTTNNCQTQSSLWRVENHADEIKNYFDGNEMSDWCGLTMFTFESDLENPLFHRLQDDFFSTAVTWSICTTMKCQFLHMIFNTSQRTVKLSPACDMLKIMWKNWKFSVM